MPVGTTEIKVESQAFVYFNADRPVEIEPIILDGDEVMLRDAIRALNDAGLLSADDQRKHRDRIDPKVPKSVIARLREWRRRNAPES